MGRIAVRLVYSITRLDVTKKENIWLLVCTRVAVESIIVKLESGDQQSYSVLNEN